MFHKKTVAASLFELALPVSFLKTGVKFFWGAKGGLIAVLYRSRRCDRYCKWLVSLWVCVCEICHKNQDSWSFIFLRVHRTWFRTHITFRMPQKTKENRKFHIVFLCTKKKTRYIMRLLRALKAQKKKLLSSKWWCVAAVELNKIIRRN